MKNWFENLGQRIWLRLVRKECRKCADILIWLGENNGDAQGHINDAKDALYRSGIATTDELYRLSNKRNLNSKNGDCACCSTLNKKPINQKQTL